MFHEPAAKLEEDLERYRHIQPPDYMAVAFLALSTLLALLGGDRFAAFFFFAIAMALFAARWWGRRSLLKRWGAALQHEKAEAEAEAAARAERIQFLRQES
jgi:hypothetical protein